MVIGGDVDFGSSRTNTVELLTPNATLAPKCRKNVESLFGEKSNSEIGQIDEFDATHMTGLFVKDAPISNVMIDLVYSFKYSNQSLLQYVEERIFLGNWINAKCMTFPTIGGKIFHP